MLVVLGLAICAGEVHYGNWLWGRGIFALVLVTAVVILFTVSWKFYVNE